MRPIQASIHLDAFRHNLQVVRTFAPKSAVMAVVKANGYGHGLLAAAQGLADAEGFAVLGLEEGIVLREAGYKQTILMLEGVFHPDELPEASVADISVAVHHDAQIAMLEQTRLPKPVDVFVKMNNGMNRLGFQPHRYAEAVHRLAACPNVRRITLMTHFATADETPGVADPLARFRQATEGMDYPVSLANSAAILRHPETHADWVRAGIMLYGASPVAGVPARDFHLQPAMTLSSKIIAVQTVNPGEGIGYGNRYTTVRDTRVGIVACGYADGYPRHAPNGTPVLVADRMTQTIGRVSMDMLSVDLTDIPEADVGSPVELWGSRVPVDAVAERAGTIGYELLCAIAPRVPVRVVN
ncbi:MAG TPA: alanine racemase [Methylophilaceae bacterium]|jgi:alanine racemase